MATAALKYAIIIPDGCGDQPIAELGGRTPLQAAKLPAMDAIAADGRVVQTDNTPTEFPAGSEVANLCLLGYDPHRYFTGRAPLEAAASGIELGKHDFAIRTNIVRIENGVMKDFTADHIDDESAAAILRTANERLRGSDSPLADEDLRQRMEFVPGVSYRNLLIYRGDASVAPPFSSETRTMAPHDLTDLAVADDFPRGPGSDVLVRLMNDSPTFIADHPANKQRVQSGKQAATHLWLWGLGGAPNLPSFESRFGVRGVMITAVDLLRGIAALAGWPRIEVEGATGYLDTDYAAKGRAAVQALEEYDLVCVHIEAPDEASHEGRHAAKIEALQQIDHHIVGPLRDALRQYGHHRILVTPDHPTFCSTKKHTHGPIPAAMCGSGIQVDDAKSYDEATAAESPTRYEHGWDLMPDFVGSS